MLRIVNEGCKTNKESKPKITYNKESNSTYFDIVIFLIEFMKRSYHVITAT